MTTPILVTGVPGWLGSRLVEILQEREGTPGTIRCLVQRIQDRPGAGISSVWGDVRDREALQCFFGSTKGGILFHLAGIIHPTHGIKELYEVNTMGTYRILHAAEEAGVKRVVYVSSNSPFGTNEFADQRFTEQSKYRPHMQYGRSKMHAELFVQSAQKRGKIETVIVRPCWYYGPHQPARQTRFFQMIAKGRFPILGGGTQRRSMSYIDNVVEGLLLAASVPEANGKAYWIADEQPYTINEIVDTVRDVLTEAGIPCKPQTLHLPAVTGRLAQWADRAIQATGRYNQAIHVLGEMGSTIACSIDKAKAELGYRPAVALREGMCRSVQWCLQNGVDLA